jgi:transposase
VEVEQGVCEIEAKGHNVKKIVQEGMQPESDRIMSLQPSKGQEIPEATQRIARKAFRKPTAVMVLRDQLGELYRDKDFAELYPRVGQGGLAPEMLALVTVYQYMEELSDREVADAVRARIDLKYALGLELDDSGFDASVLTEFRARLVEGDKTTLLLDRLLEVCKEQGLVKAGGKQRTDSTHVVGAVRLLNQIELVMESMRHALNRLAVVAPEWVVQRIPAEWRKRYGPRVSDFRLPKDEAKRQSLAVQVGSDGYQLLEWLHDDWAETPFQRTPIWELGEVEGLRQIWLQQFYRENDTVQLRKTDNMPPVGQLIMSPHDVAVRFSRKRTTTWVGDMAHFSETCDDDLPHLVTHVEATPSTQRDQSVLGTIHKSLQTKDLSPSEHYVDSGYLSAANLIDAQQQQIELIGPMLGDTHWQAVGQDGYDLTAFAVDWDKQVVTCPQDQQSSVWSQSTRKGETVIRVRFNQDDCLNCQARARCTTAQTSGRSLQLHAQSHQEALQAARDRQLEPGFGSRYARRVGIEGTISQAVHVCGLRYARYIGLAKTKLQLNTTAAAINCYRLADWLCPNYKRSTVAHGAFARLTISHAALY